MYAFAIAAGAMALYFVVAAVQRPRPAGILAAVLWGAYSVYEYYVANGTLCDTDCNIRVDLVLFLPLLGMFDAVAGALGLCVRQADEAEAAIALERAATRALLRQPDLPPLAGAAIDSQNRLDLRGLVPPLLAAHASGSAADGDAAAAGFHLALADALAQWAASAAHAQGCARVCLGGGCFANRILRERVTARLQSAGLTVLSPCAHSCGDAALALGQAWVAQRQLLRQTPHSPLPHSPLPFTQESTPCA